MLRILDIGADSKLHMPCSILNEMNQSMILADILRHGSVDWVAIACQNDTIRDHCIGGLYLVLTTEMSMPFGR